MGKNKRKNMKRTPSPNANTKNGTHIQIAHETLNAMKDLAPVCFAIGADATKDNQKPEAITITLPFEQFEVLKTSILAAVFDAAKALELNMDKLAWELSMKAAVYSAVDYDFTQYKEILKMVNSRSSEGGE